MLKKTEKGYWILEKFASQEGLIHGFSTRKFGNLRARKSLAENKNIGRFLKIFNLEKRDLTLMEQIHGDKIKVVAEDDKEEIIPGIDGMICFQKGIILGVKVADCLPILFYDKEKKVIGIAHAGWKGTLKKIGPSIVKKMKLLGSKPKNIFVGIGPHIGDCCYTVSKKRADKFEKEFGNLKGMICEDCEGIHLDLTVPTIVQLIKVGIPRANIDFGLNCTSCQIDEFFSFRREKGSNGALLGVIGLV